MNKIRKKLKFNYKKKVNKFKNKFNKNNLYYQLAKISLYSIWNSLFYKKRNIQILLKKKMIKSL